MKTVSIKKVKSDAQIPTLGSDKAAGYDVYAYIDNEQKSVWILPGTMQKIGIGVAMTAPPGYFAGVFPRSGLSTKQGLRPANCVGVCDEDYTGEYIVALYNDSNEVQQVRHGDRIAQLIFLPYIHVDFVEVEELGATERAAGGFGSTDKK